ncbi:PREDICTED: protein FAR-RED IMPAIRED RESPONSE 1 isoform X1 [Fragaria vesca subsp. vesca]|uniref:protein FAR-RED IMPAIRED RESPONSE 1 isoform X1 n=1 Tax=Fragaria vesca subsp. vesca TaxID=101020 RepID=UPI0002C2F100|nr:PREDICTED: protein FAR-RED IMPAIRED RESPONSE 1 isoform X1 [Fragaria vesca subsp. vesca]XP_011460505.1 PREDICTED: protein FAR-RED IMPAIRED RESPONSE 1 isoform X1 [Fragaria vesca subsp. vesca]XP_011460506.1 PREDICTED: protein FAR-RED IMPAIRED RESPONSE 1 isoform X1 [Fragaria vesca subsp. vesca]
MGIDLEQPSGEFHQADNGPGGNSHMVDGREENTSGDRVIVSVTNVPVNDREIAGKNGSVSNFKNRVDARDEINLNAPKNIELHDGLEFESKEEAFSFYKEYAKSMGFAAVIKASRRSRASGKFIDAKFACSRYGTKPETSQPETAEPVSHSRESSICLKRKRGGRASQSLEKTDCKACMHVKRRQDGRWTVCTLIKEHNHDIFPDEAYYFRGHRKLDISSGNVGGNVGGNVDGLNAIRRRTKNLFANMSRQSGGYKKSTNPKGGGKNQSPSVHHLSLEEGDAQVMLDHFLCMQDENPNFFYAIDLNEEQRLRNVFWVDAKGRLDYEIFSDVVFLDTTYIKNEYKLPFAPFIGVNHHLQFISLGCALLADESKSTYVWLMRAWLKAMGGHAPRVILTDQDKFLKEAVAEVFPDSRHCFCLWHILGKMPEKLGYVTRQHDQFMENFNECIFKSWTIEQVEIRWFKMVDRFNLRNDIWLQSLFEDRRQWIPAFMRGIFLAGMSTTQQSESLNCFFDKYMQRKTTLKEFLEQYNTILCEKYEEEAKADFETWHKQPALKSPSPFGKQMATLYTHVVFKKFQVEVLGVVACHPKKEAEDGAIKTFRVQDFEEDHHFIVEWNELTSDISCLCHSFEFNGFLCRHVMIVLQISGVHNIPSQYILKRWTKDAKSRQTRGVGSSSFKSRVQLYNDLCRRAFELGDEGSLSQESYNIAFVALEEALRNCENMNNSIQRVIHPVSPETHGSHSFEGVNQGNSTNKMNKKNSTSKKGQVHSEPEVLTIEMQESWQGLEQLSSSATTLDGYIGPQQLVQGMGPLNTISSRRENYYSNQHMQGLGQLNSITHIQDAQYINQQRLHGVGQFHFRPQTIPNFVIADDPQDVDHSTVGRTQIHGLASKHLQSKHPSCQ